MVCRLDLRVTPAETMLTVYCEQLTVVRGTLLQGAHFINQGILEQVGRDPFTKFHIVKSYPNDEFSIHTIITRGASFVLLESNTGEGVIWPSVGW